MGLGYLLFTFPFREGTKFLHSGCDISDQRQWRLFNKENQYQVSHNMGWLSNLHTTDSRFNQSVGLLFVWCQCLTTFTVHFHHWLSNSRPKSSRSATLRRITRTGSVWECRDM